MPHSSLVILGDGDGCIFPSLVLKNKHSTRRWWISRIHHERLMLWNGRKQRTTEAGARWNPPSSMENCWEEYDKDTTLKRWGWEFTIRHRIKMEKWCHSPFFVWAWMPPDATRAFEGLQRFDSSILCSQCLIQHRGRCGETHPRKRMAKVGDGWSGWSYPKHPIILSESGHCPISSQHSIYTFH